MLVAHKAGITKTIRWMQRLTTQYPAHTGDISAYSDKIDKIVKKHPFLFGPQICLIRGLMLFYFGKRRGMNVQLKFGSKIVPDGFETHCWIVLDGKVHFEVDEVIRQYVTLVEYA